MLSEAQMFITPFYEEFLKKMIFPKLYSQKFIQFSIQQNDLQKQLQNLPPPSLSGHHLHALTQQVLGLEGGGGGRYPW